MVAHKGQTSLVDSSSSVTTPQAKDNPPKIISSPSINKEKAQKTTIAQDETTPAFKASESSRSIPKLAMDLDAYFEALSQKSTPTTFGASGSRTVSRPKPAPIGLVS
ncbi:hypothetical protein CsSME_00008064 [Camellia sinensis var. sinensis]